MGVYLEVFFPGDHKNLGGLKSPPPVGLSWLRPTVGLGLMNHEVDQSLLQDTHDTKL